MAYKARLGALLGAPFDLIEKQSNEIKMMVREYESRKRTILHSSAVHEPPSFSPPSLAHVPYGVWTFDGWSGKGVLRLMGVLQ